MKYGLNYFFFVTELKFRRCALHIACVTRFSLRSDVCTLPSPYRCLFCCQKERLHKS